MKNAFSVILVEILFIVSAYVRFTNPELTETQLFIEYLHLWIIVIVVGVILVYDRNRNNHRPR